jgi:hypothetical protein
VQVLLTVGLIAVLAMWAVMVVRRLARMREEVRLAWKKLETDQSNEAVKSVYNKHVAAYNDALQGFPANVVGPMAGFKPARAFAP